MKQQKMRARGAQSTWTVRLHTCSNQMDCRSRLCARSNPHLLFPRYAFREAAEGCESTLIRLCSCPICIIAMLDLPGGAGAVLGSFPG